MQAARNNTPLSNAGLHFSCNAPNQGYPLTPSSRQLALLPNKPLDLRLTRQACVAVTRKRAQRHVIHTDVRVSSWEQAADASISPSVALALISSVSSFIRTFPAELRALSSEMRHFLLKHRVYQRFGFTRQDDHDTEVMATPYG